MISDVQSKNIWLGGNSKNTQCSENDLRAIGLPQCTGPMLQTEMYGTKDWRGYKSKSKMSDGETK